MGESRTTCPKCQVCLDLDDSDVAPQEGIFCHTCRILFYQCEGDDFKCNHLCDFLGCFLHKDDVSYYPNLIACHDPIMSALIFDYKRFASLSKENEDNYCILVNQTENL